MREMTERVSYSSGEGRKASPRRGSGLVEIREAKLWKGE